MLKSLFPKLKQLLALEFEFDQATIDRIFESAVGRVWPGKAADSENKEQVARFECAVVGEALRHLTQLSLQDSFKLLEGLHLSDKWDQIGATVHWRALDAFAHADFLVPDDWLVWLRNWIRLEAAVHFLSLHRKDAIRALRRPSKDQDVENLIDDAISRIATHPKLRETCLSKGVGPGLIVNVAKNILLERRPKARVRTATREPHVILYKLMKRVRKRFAAELIDQKAKAQKVKRKPKSKEATLTAHDRTELTQTGVAEAFQYLSEELLSAAPAGLLKRLFYPEPTEDDAKPAPTPPVNVGLLNALAEGARQLATYVQLFDVPISPVLPSPTALPPSGELPRLPDDQVELRGERALERAIADVPDEKAKTRHRLVLLLRIFGGRENKFLAEASIGQIIGKSQATVNRWLQEAYDRFHVQLFYWSRQDKVLRELCELPPADPSTSEVNDDHSSRHRVNFWLAAMIGATTRLSLLRPRSADNRLFVALEHWWTKLHFEQAKAGEWRHPELCPSEGYQLELDQATGDFRRILDSIIDQRDNLTSAGERLLEWIQLLREERRALDQLVETNDKELYEALIGSELKQNEEVAQLSRPPQRTAPRPGKRRRA